MLLKLARLICANRVELVSCNMLVSHKPLCKNKDKFVWETRITVLWLSIIIWV
jgi:hypothetical protein